MGCCFSSEEEPKVPSGGRTTGYREQPAPQALPQRRQQESSGYQSWGSGRAGGASVQTQQDAEARAIAAERVGAGSLKTGNSFCVP
ncbi:hypothetical protein DUNSADRAFT_4518 [Dunaliella salina]|uniref:Encoded protein n=1 Tax=Dunaliella salina TaxID=3046 RepID=A0ABQ7FUS8_DUNSA|nr:hypothetical protein DUNSADRAFT_4518 [Dunaliella salina]|eukprot:KAF5826156.1 hypothetical protein DUNSADRAFT_4518 [Dunaliella salina]